MSEPTKKRGRGRPRKNPVPETVVEEVEIVEESTPKVEQVQVDTAPTQVVEDSVDNETFTGDPIKQSSNEGTFGNFNPLAENVVHREYATPKTAEGLTEDIPEPSFGANEDLSFDDLMNSPQGGEEGEEGGQAENANPFDNPNPALNDLPPQEKQIACESLVDTLLDTYASLHSVASNFVKFPEDKLNEMILNDEIDGSMRMPLESGGDVSLPEFVQSYNEQVDEALTYDRDFGMKVRPAMIRVFMKKGWGMTDEQMLLVMFGKDVIFKASQCYALTKGINSTISLLKDIHQESKGGIPTQKKETPSYTQEDVPNEDIKFEKPTPEPVEELIIDDETSFENVPQSDSQTEKFNIEEFKRPEEQQHPKEVQEVMDRLNAEAAEAKKNKEN